MLGQFLMRGVVLSHQEHAAGVAIEAVDDAGAQLAGGARERVETVQKRVYERSRMHACTGMHHHTGGLVNGHDVGIFVQDRERDLLGGGAKRGWMGGCDVNDVGGAQLV